MLSLIGAATLKADEKTLQRLIDAVLPLAVGALMGDALLHLLPDAMETMHNRIAVGAWALGGFLLFFALDFALHVRHEEVGPTRKTASKGTDKTHILNIGRMSIAANSVHNFVDGVVIAGTFVANPAAGAATLVAVILHEIPHEAANYGILLHANYSRRRALVLNLLVGLVAMAGAITAILVGSRSHVFIAGLLPFTAGCFIYMACIDLIPSIVKRHNGCPPMAVPALILVGIALMGAMLFIEPK